MKKKNMQTTIEFIFLFVIIFSLMFFMIGFHNVDLSYNILKYSYDNDVNWYYKNKDCNNFICYSYVKLYIIGMETMRISLGTLVLVSAIFYIYKRENCSSE